MAETDLVLTDASAALIRRGLTIVVFVIAGLSFAFGFGNGWLLGLKLGVPGWIAPLVAPAVDLSVVALLAALHYLRARGLGGRLYSARLLLIVCGLITFALNTMRSVLAGATGRACFDAIAPMLLIGWSEVGPRLLALLHGRSRTLRTTGPVSAPRPSPSRRTVPDRPRNWWRPPAGSIPPTGPPPDGRSPATDCGPRWLSPMPWPGSCLRNCEQRWSGWVL